MPSLSDQFIDTMAALRAIDPDNDEPARHQMRQLRMYAEQIIGNALTQAYSLAYLAKDMQREVAGIIKDERATSKETQA